MRGLKKSQEGELADLRDLLRSGLVMRFGVAIDGGAHVGGWTAILAIAFDKVIAFEPAEDTRSLLTENVGGVINVQIRGEALMDIAQPVEMIFPRKSRALTSRRAEPAIAGKVHAIAIDDLKLDALDLLKLDLEGAEPLALKGAQRTIERTHPFIIIEEFGLGKAYGFPVDEARRILLGWGYDHVWDAGPNQGFSHKAGRR
jgi:FkbM family methyltransferase